MTRFNISVILCVLVPLMLPGQSTLERTRQEIERLERAIKDKQASEQSLMSQIEDVNREIGLRKKLMNNLESAKQNKIQDIRNTRLRLEQALEEENLLKELIAKRMVSIYKRGRQSEWEMLLTLSSLNQMLVWMRYQKLIIDNDRRNLNLLKEKQRLIENETLRLETDLSEQQKLIEQTTEEAATLADRRQSRETLLHKVRNDASALRQQLEDRRRAYSQIARRIQQENQTPLAPGRWKGDGKFSQLKGKMQWPVTGKVKSRYGVVKNPILKTETFNQGIEIETTPNATVNPTCLGMVKWVWWQRGMGNLVVVDHGKGYYTVYGYLDMVLVDTGTEVDSQTIIGEVGDKNSLYGPTLHFEIWNNTEHQNPESWLR
jgi:septal ring factor EnvC (AmiA/AmiB activator)